MPRFKYYWLLNPVKSIVENEQVRGYHVCNRSLIVDGGSPLGMDGRIFFDMLQRSVGLYDHSLWVFRNTEFRSQEEANTFSDIFRIVSESFYTFKVSFPGFIIVDSKSHEIVAKQPPQAEVYQSVKIDTINEGDLVKVFELSEKLHSINSEESSGFLSILDYLRDIKNSPVFVGELALWSFVEHYWSQNQGGNTDINQSLKSILEFVYENKQDRKDFNSLVRSVGSDLGKQYDEHMLRNILAHGKHITLKENWTKDNWSAFYEVHDRLLSIVLSGIEKQICAAQI
ncbi:MAG: hypothetical protein GYB21_02490 [Oceanospirillales bacterium]|nr:hypothetical protein [Oceanospirillales bacterium]